MNTRTADISVVIPAYNVEAFIRPCLESVLSQTLPPKEILVVDDGSTDLTAEIVKEFIRHHPQIQLLQLAPKKNKQRRTAMALKTGIAKASSTFIALMDADDICFPERLQVQAEYLMQHEDICAVGSSIQLINKNGRKGGVLHKHADGKRLTIQLPSESPFYQNTVMFRSTLLKKTGLKYDETFEYAEDYEFFSRLARQADLMNIEQPLVYYRQHENQSVKNKQFEKAVQHISVREAQQSLKLSDEEAQQFWLFVNHRNGLNAVKPKQIRNYARKLIDDNNRNRNFLPDLFDPWIDAIVFRRLFSRKKYTPLMLLELFAYKPLTLISTQPLNVLRFIAKCLLGKRVLDEQL